MQWNKNLFVLESTSREQVRAAQHPDWETISLSTQTPIVSLNSCSCSLCCISISLADHLPAMRGQPNTSGLLHTDSLNAFSWLFPSEFQSLSYTRKPQVEKKTKQKKNNPYQLYWLSLHVYIMPQRFLDLGSKSSNPDMLWTKEICFIFLWTLIYKKNSISTVCLYIGETRKWVWFCMSSY